MAGVRITIKMAGGRSLESRWSQRVNLMGSERMRRMLQTLGGDIVRAWQANIQSFTPGTARDLAPGYKAWKQKVAGHVYPILWLTGQFVSSMRSSIARQDGWLVRVEFQGQHYSGVSNRELAERHIKSGRDFTRLSQEFWNRWSQRLQREISRTRPDKG